MSSCYTDGANPNCTCPSFTSKQIIRKNAFGVDNPTEDRYFCSYISEECKRKIAQGNPNHSSCSCLRNNGYADCVCPGNSKKVYFPYGTIPGFQRDEINCCGDPTLHSKLIEKCEAYEARYGKLPIPITPIQNVQIQPVTTPATTTPATTAPATTTTTSTTTATAPPAAVPPAADPPTSENTAPTTSSSKPSSEPTNIPANRPTPPARNTSATPATTVSAPSQGPTLVPGLQGTGTSVGAPRRGYGRGNTGIYAASAAGGTTALGILGLGLMLLL